MKICLFFLSLTFSVFAQISPRISSIGIVEDQEILTNLPFSADFNGDEYIDLALPSSEDDLISLLSNDGSGNFSPNTIELIPASYLTVAPDLSVDHFFIGDVDQDGDPDIVIGYLFEPVIDVADRKLTCVTALNDGNGNFQFPLVLPATFLNGIENNSCSIIDLVDWDHDGDLDLISVATNSGNVGWRENFGDGTFSTLTRFLAPLVISVVDLLGNLISLSADAVFGDANGDGYTDLYVSGFIDPSEIDSNLDPFFSSEDFEVESLLILNDGTGAVLDRQVLPLTNFGNDALGNILPISQISLADLNQDGSADLIFPNTSIDLFGNFISLGFSFVLSAGGAEPFPSENFLFTFSLSEIDSFDFGRLVDFDGDASLEYASQRGFIQPSIFGPEFSSEFDFFGPNNLFANLGLSADYDGDGDLDFIASDFSSENPNEIFLVRNLIVDETSSITFTLQEQGLVGAQANPDADPDQDQRTNFEELIEGSNPLVNDAPGRDPFLLEVTSLRQASFVAQQRALDAGITYEVFVSTDLESWQSLPASALNPYNSRTEVQFTTDSSVDPTCFFQLKITP